MNNTLPGILAPVPRLARYLIFSLKPAKKALMDLRELGRSPRFILDVLSYATLLPELLAATWQCFLVLAATDYLSSETAKTAAHLCFRLPYS